MRRTCSFSISDSISALCLYPTTANAGKAPSAAIELRTVTTQPALFVIEYALARLLMGWGIKPQAMLGHSVGEFVAACLAGVFSLGGRIVRWLRARGTADGRLPAGGRCWPCRRPKRKPPRLLKFRTFHWRRLMGRRFQRVSGPAAAIARLEEELGKRGLEGLPPSHLTRFPFTDDGADTGRIRSRK